MSTLPAFRDVLVARSRIAPYLSRTLLMNYPALDKLIGARVFVKHENHQPVGAFKVRGGVNLVSELSREDKERGVAAASTGNHGQSVAYAARLFGVPATIFVPENANPLKVESMRRLGANVVFHGRIYDDAREECERFARDHKLRYVHSGNEPLLIAGVGTLALEIIEDVPDVEVIMIPVGGGSAAAGACIVANTINPDIRVIGVQSEGAPAGWKSWRAGRLVEDKMETIAEGLATRTAFEMPQQIMREHLADFVLVSDDEIRRGIVTYLDCARTLAEAAGAAPLAAAMKLRDQLAGNTVALVLSGGNTTLDQLKSALEYKPF
jgi:threonine dehydratase